MSFTQFNALCFSLVGLAIVTSCICRVGAMELKRHRRGWSLMYVCMGAFAFSATLDMLYFVALPDESTLLGLAAIAINLALTHHDWLSGPPRIAQKYPPRTRAEDRRLPRNQSLDTASVEDAETATTRTNDAEPTS